MPARAIQEQRSYSVQFSICTLVNNLEEYAGMTQSFIEMGFSEADCEYLYADNTLCNKFEAYNGINHFLNEASGKYVIICHQDILLTFDNRADLEERINELNQLDNNWAVCGNAGGFAPNHIVYSISHDQEDKGKIKGVFPEKIKSLDENFLLVRADAHISLSNDLSGFHLYGTDICIISDILGYSCYVIDFHLHHKSTGNPGKRFKQSKRRFLAKYNHALRGRFTQTTIDKFYISGSRSKNFFYNSFLVMFFVRMYYGVKKRLR